MLGAEYIQDTNREVVFYEDIVQISQSRFSDEASCFDALSSMPPHTTAGPTTYIRTKCGRICTIDLQDYRNVSLLTGIQNNMPLDHDLLYHIFVKTWIFYAKQTNRV